MEILKLVSQVTIHPGWTGTVPVDTYYPRQMISNPRFHSHIHLCLDHKLYGQALAGLGRVLACGLRVQSSIPILGI